MDIANITASSRVVDILHPVTQEPIGLKVKLLPPSDPKVEAARRKTTNRRLNSRNNKITAEQLEAEGLELLIASIDGWQWVGNANFQGEQLEFNADNARRVFKAARWIRDQIDREAGDSEAFFEG